MTRFLSNPIVFEVKQVQSMRRFNKAS